MHSHDFAFSSLPVDKEVRAKSEGEGLGMGGGEFGGGEEEGRITKMGRVMLVSGGEWGECVKVMIGKCGAGRPHGV